MSDKTELSSLVNDELLMVMFELNNISEQHSSESNLNENIINHVLSIPGKQLRPSVTIICSKIWNEEVDDRVIKMATAVVFDPSLLVVIVLLAFLAWPAFVRNVRAEILTLKERDYIMYARVAGASKIRLMLTHLLPGVINTVIVIATLRIGQLILAEASLSFLGAGVPPPTPVWGALVAEGRDYLNSAWWVSMFPSVGIFLVVMSLNFLGDWFRDRFDPRLRQLGN